MTLRDKLETKALQRLSRPGPTTAFRKQIINLVEITPGTNVIDIATAVGGMAFALREKTEHITAIDAMPDRIEIAKSDPRADQINFMVVDTTNTPFADNEFDLSFIVLGLHEMGFDGAKKALQEARRISQRLVVVEFGLDRWPLFWSFFRYPLAIFEPPGFLKFTRRNIREIIEDTGWSVIKSEADFPFEAFACERSPQ